MRACWLCLRCWIVSGFLVGDALSANAVAVSSPVIASAMNLFFMKCVASSSPLGFPSGASVLGQTRYLCQSRDWMGGNDSGGVITKVHVFRQSNELYQ